ncbi:glycosyltransferase [Acidicapsa ligni]|uniref:glycosyltransferase n=1 Tax=Acidicapsa ligni TaxID=542300 RepID=UPI0021DF6860|nr:glycosyltransferase [Acidicapsa ligni]
MSENPTGNNDALEACIIIPCYNEESRLPRAQFLEFVQKHPQISFLFVNDGSTDNTLSMLEKLCSSTLGGLSLLNLQANSGKAEAVRLGMLHAMLAIQPKYVGFWDADLATPLDEIPRFVRKLNQNSTLQMVFGARVRLLGRQVRRKSSRHYLGRLFATVVSIVLNVPVYDTQCGAKLFRVDPTFSQILEEPFLSRWIFDVEIVARAIRAAHGNRKLMEQYIFELPLMKWDDVAGSKLHSGDFVRAILDIIRIHQKYLS